MYRALGMVIGTKSMVPTGCVDADLVAPPIYLDGFATLPLATEARDAMMMAWSQPGNAGSANASGERAAQIIARGRSAVADLIGAAPSEIVFTSGATEANNLALLGVVATAGVLRPERRHILISAVEHKSVMEPARQLEATGFRVSIAPVDHNGRLDMKAFAHLVADDLLLASVMLVNNETGVIQPVREATELVHAVNGLMHCDAAQAAGKIAIDVLDLEVDYLSLSAHKCYGPMGIGALYIAAVAPKPTPLLHGGGQQNEVRPGTEPVALIAGFGAAAIAATQSLPASQKHAARLVESLLEALHIKQLRFRRITGSAPIVAGSAALHLLDVDCDMLCAVAARHVSLSTGSACTGGQLKVSHVLDAIGLSSNESRSVVRIFCHRFLRYDDIALAADRIIEAAHRSRLATGDPRQ